MQEGSHPPVCLPVVATLLVLFIFFGFGFGSIYLFSLSELYISPESLLYRKSCCILFIRLLYYHTIYNYVHSRSIHKHSSINQSIIL